MDSETVRAIKRVNAQLSVDAEMERSEPPLPKSPIHQSVGKWWFYDETWCCKEGPFKTEEDARKALSVYVTKLYEYLESLKWE